MLAKLTVEIHLCTHCPTLVDIAGFIDHISIWNVTVRRCLDRGTVIVSQTYTVTVNFTERFICTIATCPITTHFSCQTFQNSKAQKAVEACREALVSSIVFISICNRVVGDILHAAHRIIDLLIGVTNGTNIGQVATIVFQPGIRLHVRGEVSQCLPTHTRSIGARVVDVGCHAYRHEFVGSPLIL